MSYIYPITTYKPVTGPESFDFIIGLSTTQVTDLLFMSSFDPTFFVAIGEEDGVELNYWDRNDAYCDNRYVDKFNPYRIVVSTTKGLDSSGVLDNIIFRIDGLK